MKSYSSLRRGISVVLAAVAMASSLSAQSTKEPMARFAIGAEVGTAGYGPVALFTASKHFTVSVGYTMLDYDDSYSSDDANYDAKLKMSNVQAAVNYHPFGGTFFLSGGAFISDSKVDAVAVPNANATFDVDGTTYTAAQVGTIKGHAPLIDGTVPFVGLGWSKSPGKSGFGFFFEVGVLFIDAPVVTLTSTGGTLSNDPAFKAKLASEASDINADLKDYDLYPVVQLGLIYRF